MSEPRMLTKTGLLSAAVLLFFAPAVWAEEIDWDTVQGADITLFYPGQASWEWVLTKSSHSGATKFREGKNCSECHEGEEQAMGTLIVSGEKLEPQPIERKRGFIPVNVKVAYDDTNFYMRLEWTEQGVDGFPTMDPDFEAKVTVMFDDGSLAEATRAGCWGSCHSDNTGMSDNAGNELVKYLSKSRAQNTRTGGGTNYKPEADIEALRAEGNYLEYWQARLNHDAQPVPASGHILKAREENAEAGISVSSTYTHGTWVVVISRPLDAACDYRKTLTEGVTYTFGVAIHEAFAARRFHHVSFDHTFVLGSGEGDFVALKK